MSELNVTTDRRAEVLRRDFDHSFAAAPEARTATHEELLAIAIGGDPYVVRLADVSGVAADRKSTWLPGPVSELRGLVGWRGAVLPLYDLRSLLGYPATEESRWLLLPSALKVALAFDRFDGHLRVPRTNIARDGGGGTHHRYVQEVVHIDGTTRPLVHVPAVLDRIQALVRQGTAQRSND